MDKMREDFEAWYSDFDGYGDAHKQELWEGWKASRAALCVELPDFSKHEDGGEWWAGYTCAVSDVKSGLNQIGVTCK